MDEPVNSASRLLAIARKAMAYTVNGRKALDLWTAVFSLDKEGKLPSAVIVAERLVWVASEVNYMEAYFVAKSAPQHLYAPATKAVLDAANPFILSAARENVQQYFRESVTTALTHLVYQMPDDEATISKDNLDEIEQAIRALELALADAEVSNEVRLLVRRYLMLLQRAVDAYPIFGARAFSDALQDAVGPLAYASALHDRHDASASDASVVNAARILFGKVYGVASAAQKVKTVGQLAYYGVEAAKYALNHLPH